MISILDNSPCYILAIPLSEIVVRFAFRIQIKDHNRIPPKLNSKV